MKLTLTLPLSAVFLLYSYENVAETSNVVLPTPLKMTKRGWLHVLCKGHVLVNILFCNAFMFKYFNIRDEKDKIKTLACNIK